MARKYTAQSAGVLDGVAMPGRADGRVVNAKMFRILGVLDMAATQVNNGDFIVLARRPAGSAFAGLRVTSDTSLGSSTISAGTEAAPARDKAAAVFTATETPTHYGKVSALAAAPITDEEIVGITVGGANMPSTGTVVFEYFYTRAG